MAAKIGRFSLQVSVETLDSETRRGLVEMLKETSDKTAPPLEGTSFVELSVKCASRSKGFLNFFLDSDGGSLSSKKTPSPSTNSSGDSAVDEWMGGVLLQVRKPSEGR